MNNIISKIWNVDLAINKTYDVYAEKVGLSVNQLYILYYLFENENVSQSELSKNLLLPKQTINSILTPWKNKGYMNLIFSDGNKKEKKIILTEKGQEYLKNILQGIQKIEQQVIQKMGDKNALQLLQMNSLFLELLKEGIKQHERNIQ